MMGHMLQRMVDKSSILEERLKYYPYVYIQAAAASGKSVLVECTLSKNPEVKPIHILIGRDTLSQMKEKAEAGFQSEEPVWYLFDRGECADQETVEWIASLRYVLGEKDRVIIQSRDSLPEAWYELYWNRELELLTQKYLRFQRSEIHQLMKKVGVKGSADFIYELTGGWAGCCDVMIRLIREEQVFMSKKQLEEHILPHPVLASYIKRNLVNVLDQKERQILQLAAVCPWVNAELCERELSIVNGESIIKKLEAQGYLWESHEKGHLKLLPLFTWTLEGELEKQISYESLYRWYEQQQDQKTMQWCLPYINKEEIQTSFLKNYFRAIRITEITKFQIPEGDDVPVEFQYLRGLYGYATGDLEAIKEARRQVNPANGFLEAEIMVNLAWLDPSVPLEQWFELLVNLGSEETPFRIYEMLGNSLSFLCGMRDLSGLFACAKKDENRHAKLWRKYLDEDSQKIFTVAKIEYYLETEREEQITEQVQTFFREDENSIYTEQELRAYVYLFLGIVDPNLRACGAWLEERYFTQRVCVEGREEDHYREILERLRDHRKKNVSGLAIWIRDTQDDQKEEINEGNLWYYFLRCKIYFHLHQYDVAGKLAESIFAAIQGKNKYRMMAELYYQQAIIQWERENKTKSLFASIESFLLGNKYRYVIMYLTYGMLGMDVISEYTKWEEKNEPGKWQRKKKYNYGSVLYMGQADYIDYLKRGIKKQKRSMNESKSITDQNVEQLTMTETIILQSIGKGMSNEEIAEELNLKQTTVKTHIYSIYKKLSVNSRVQALNRGKEIGLF